MLTSTDDVRSASSKDGENAALHRASDGRKICSDGISDGANEFYHHAIGTREVSIDPATVDSDAVVGANVPVAPQQAPIDAVPHDDTHILLDMHVVPSAIDSTVSRQTAIESASRADTPVADSGSLEGLIGDDGEDHDVDAARSDEPPRADADDSELQFEQVVDALASLKFAVDELDAGQIASALADVLALNSSSQVAIDLICEAKNVLVTLSAELARAPLNTAAPAHDLLDNESSTQAVDQTATEIHDVPLTAGASSEEIVRSFDAFLEASADRFADTDSVDFSPSIVDPEKEAALLRAQVLAASRIVAPPRLQNRIAAIQRRAGLKADTGGRSATPRTHADGVSAPLSEVDLWTFKEAASLGPRGWQRRMQQQRQLQQQQENCKCTIS